MLDDPHSGRDHYQSARGTPRCQAATVNATTSSSAVAARWPPLPRRLSRSLLRRATASLHKKHPARIEFYREDARGCDQLSRPHCPVSRMTTYSLATPARSSRASRKNGRAKKSATSSSCAASAKRMSVGLSSATCGAAIHTGCSSVNRRTITAIRRKWRGGRGSAEAICSG